MHDLPGSVHPAPDLSRYTEATRRNVYDRVVRIQFTPETPYTPDDAGLVVFYALGRWFGTWVDLETPDDWPAARRREMVRIESSPGAPEGFMLYEV